MNRRILAIAAVLVASVATATPAFAGSYDASLYSGATWYAKFQAVSSGTPTLCTSNVGDAPQLAFGNNVDASHECGSQSETSIAINPRNNQNIIAGSNEIQRLPMRAMFSTDGGQTFTGVDLPLPPPLTNNGFDFGSDPAVAFDLRGNAYYAYIVVFFSAGGAINGTEMAVARSSDGGKTWASTYFVTFSDPVSASPNFIGATGQIGADPFVAPDGTVHVAWLDYAHSLIAESSSSNGGVSFGPSHVISPTQISLDIDIPAQNVRGALVYPSCGASAAALYCSWMDGSLATGTDVFLSRSTDGGVSWGAATIVNVDPTGEVADQFNQWLAIDPSDASVNVAYYDTGADPTRKATLYTLARSTDGGSTFARSAVANAPTDETCCQPSVNLGNQYGDYEGLAALNGVVRPVWTDRRQAVIDLGLREEVFTAALTL